MSQPHDPSLPSGSLPDPRNPADAELLHAQDVLGRTVRFLEHCARDPLGALAAENPRELIRELEVLRNLPLTGDDADAPAGDETLPRTIPLRRRRSA